MVSPDQTTWTTAFATATGKGGVDICPLSDVVGRHVRISCDQRSGTYGNSLWACELFGRTP